MRWLRAAWRHGFLLTAAVCALGAGVDSLVRYGPGPALVGAGLVFVLVYGALWTVAALEREGVLRTGRRRR